jgi:hypothetical protein
VLERGEHLLWLGRVLVLVLVLVLVGVRVRVWPLLLPVVVPRSLWIGLCAKEGSNSRETDRRVGRRGLGRIVPTGSSRIVGPMVWPRLRMGFETVLRRQRGARRRGRRVCSFVRTAARTFIWAFARTVVRPFACSLVGTVARTIVLSAVSRGIWGRICFDPQGLASRASRVFFVRRTVSRSLLGRGSLRGPRAFFYLLSSAITFLLCARTTRGVLHRRLNIRSAISKERQYKSLYCETYPSFSGHKIFRVSKFSAVKTRGKRDVGKRQLSTVKFKAVLV